MTKRQKQIFVLKTMTREIDDKVLEWNDLGEDIEDLIEARKRYAKRHKLPLLKEEENDNNTESSTVGRASGLAGRDETAPEMGKTGTHRAST
jgi:hypothetical protein